MSLTVNAYSACQVTSSTPNTPMTVDIPIKASSP
jgi:hypothetical protein